MESAFSIGANTVEACIYAGIARSSYYKWLEKNQWFLGRKEALKTKPKLKAKRILIDDMDSFDKALKYLKHVSPAEFSEKIKSDSNVKYGIDATINYVKAEERADDENDICKLIE